eukprot:SAG22_NODE_417_length_10770_cov_21.649049_5_plen_143_part_00
MCIRLCHRRPSLRLCLPRALTLMHDEYFIRGDRLPGMVARLLQTQKGVPALPFDAAKRPNASDGGYLMVVRALGGRRESRHLREVPVLPGALWAMRDQDNLPGQPRTACRHRRRRAVMTFYCCAVNERFCFLTLPFYFSPCR